MCTYLFIVFFKFLIFFHFSTIFQTFVRMLQCNFFHFVSFHFIPLHSLALSLSLSWSIILILSFFGGRKKPIFQKDSQPVILFFQFILVCLDNFSFFILKNMWASTAISLSLSAYFIFSSIIS